MVDTGDRTSGSAAGARPTLSVRQAAFIGVGSMVGAGIFALLGAAGEVAGSAVWISFLLAGGVAALQGYSFAKFGARYPSAGGFLEYVIRGWGEGHFTGVLSWLLLSVNAIITAMVAVSFGSYASDAVADNADWVKPFAVLVLLVMAALNILGSQAVARAQTVVVLVVVGILIVFSIATLSNLNIDLLAFSDYPSLARHRLQRGSDLLRLPRLRRHYLHRKGPRRSEPPTAQGDLSGTRHRHCRLPRRGLGRLWDLDGRRGGGLRRYRPRCCRGAGARLGRVLADDRHGSVRYRRCDQLRAVPGNGARGSDGHRRTVPTCAWVAGSAGARPWASSSPLLRRSSSRSSST